MNRQRKVVRRYLLLYTVVAAALQPSSGLAQASSENGQRDFDFELGSWKAQISRLKAPLSGSKEWVEYRGTNVVRKVWDGRANLAELEVEGSAGRIQGLSLRTYNPQAKQWHVHWANSRSGEVEAPMVGGFKDGGGEFYGREFFNGRAIFVRLIFSELEANSFKIEQAFSDDGGKTWETNWMAKFAR